MLNVGSIDKKIFSERIGSIQERKQKVENDVPRLEDEIAFIKISEICKDYLLNRATTLYALWDTINNKEKVKIAKGFLAGIILNKEEMIFECIYLSELMELCNPEHTHRGLSTFAKYPQYRLPLPRPIIPPNGYP